MTLERLQYLLVLSLAVTIFFQKAFVVGVSGSFKSYEAITLLAVFVVMAHVFRGGGKRILGALTYRPLFVIGLFFCLSAWLGSVTFPSLAEPEVYHSVFPQARDVFRFNTVLMPILIVGYNVICFVALWLITTSSWAHRKKPQVIRLFVYVGSFVSLYVLYGIIGIRLLGLPDIVPEFLDQRTQTPLTNFRAGGFADEPGSFVFLHAWVASYLMLYDHPAFLSRVKRGALLLLNGTALLLSFSSSLVPFLGVLSVVAFWRFQGAKRWALPLAGIILMATVWQTARHFGKEDFLIYSVRDKFINLVQVPEAVMDSGAHRAYTAMLGVEVFADYPLFGVGAGNSVFFLHEYDGKHYLSTPGGQINFGSYPQNGWVRIAAERGLFGLLLFVAFWILLFRQFKRHWGKLGSLQGVALVGSLFTMIAIVAVGPIHSIFIWFNIGVLLNELYFSSDRGAEA